MAIGIGSSFNEEENDDKPLFGRHYLEDFNTFPSLILSRENLLNHILNLSKEDRQWIERKLEEDYVSKSRKAFNELRNKNFKK